MSSTPHSTDSDNSLEIIRSPYRPFPLGAKKALRQATQTLEYDDGDPRTAYVDEVPDSEILNEWELEHIRTDTPEEIWETDRGQRIEIYTDRVEENGRELTISPEEAKAAARDQDTFSRITENA